MIAQRIRGLVAFTGHEGTEAVVAGSTERRERDAREVAT